MEVHKFYMLNLQQVIYNFVILIFSTICNRAELMKKLNGAYFPEEVCLSHGCKLVSLLVGNF